MLVKSITLFALSLLFGSHLLASAESTVKHEESEEDIDAKFHEGADIHTQDNHDTRAEALPKDKILLSQVKSLTFQRNKRTTSRRTHSIPQLSCVGGTAGCKLFTTDLVECENVGQPEAKTLHVNQINWRCKADISERVRFQHVEVICEGYDYPEDDYILLGSCGLEFTLDYADPHDYHDNSYFKHMDEHEKELHHERVRQKAAAVEGQQQQQQATSSSALLLMESSHLLGILLFLLVATALILIVRLFHRKSSDSRSRSNNNNNNSNKRQPSIRSYGPLTSAVLTTKKAC